MTKRERNWNHMPPKQEATPVPKGPAWWTLAARPEDRNHFMTLAKIRQ